MAARHDVGLGERQRLPGRDPDLADHEVDAGEHLGHRVLDLDPAVDLDEVEAAIAVDQELEGADVLVAGRHDRPDRPRAQVVASLGRQRRCRALLEDLLVPPLDAAVALTEVDAAAIAVDRDLDFDVARLVQPALEVQRVVAERGTGLGAADVERGLELTGRPDHPHPLAAATGRRLDQERVADPLAFRERVGVVAEDAVRPRDRRQAERAEEPPRRFLVREPVEDVGRRPDERQVVSPDDLGKALVLGQEAVAGMDRVTAGHDRGADHRRRAQVAPPCVGRPDADRLVGQLDGQRLAIGLAVGDDGLDPERPARPQDSEGDLAAVGDEDLAEHQASLASPARSAARAVASSMTISSCPYSTAWPGSTRLAPTIPSAGATTSWGTPSTSTAPSRSPDRTRVPVFASARGWKIPGRRRRGGRPCPPGPRPSRRPGRCRSTRPVRCRRLRRAASRGRCGGPRSRRADGHARRGPAGRERRDRWIADCAARRRLRDAGRGPSRDPRRPRSRRALTRTASR